MTGDKQTQCFSRMVFTVSALMTGEVALLSQIISELIQGDLFGHFRSTGNNEIGRLLLGIS